MVELRSWRCLRPIVGRCNGKGTTMINQGIVAGKVIEVYDDRDARMVVVRTGGGRKKNGGEWEEFAVCRFYGEPKRFTERVEPGAFVKVDGVFRSRKLEKGWFSGFEARYLQPIEMPQAGQGGSFDNDPF